MLKWSKIMALRIRTERTLRRVLGEIPRSARPVMHLPYFGGIYQVSEEDNWRVEYEQSNDRGKFIMASLREARINGDAFAHSRTGSNVY